MKNKRFIFIGILAIVIAIAGYSLFATLQQQKVEAQAKTDTVTIQKISSEIQAEGTITPQTQATLHFQTGGKLKYLPYQQGDRVYQGATIAQLDSYQLEQEMLQAANTYRSAQDSFNQTQEVNNTGSLARQQSAALKTAGGALGGDQDYTVANDAAKRIIDENQATLDNAAINVKLTNYAMSLSTLTAPFTGVITHEDVTVAGQNITPATGFTISDLTSLVFRANVNENDIDFVQVGAPASVQLDGLPQALSGVVSKVYPNKQALANGQSTYQVDISVNNLPKVVKMDQMGIVNITSSANADVMLVPTWTVLGHQSVWVMENGQPVLKNVTIGKTHGSMVEILGGLNPNDSVIVNPAAIAGRKYQLLSL